MLLPPQGGDNAVLIVSQDGGLGHDLDVGRGLELRQQVRPDLEPSLSGVLFFRTEKFVGLLDQLSSQSIIPLQKQYLRAQGGG